LILKQIIVHFFFKTIVKVLSCWYEALVIWLLLGWERKMSNCTSAIWCKGAYATEYVQFYFSVSQLSLFRVFWYKICLHLKLFWLENYWYNIQTWSREILRYRCFETKGFRVVQPGLWVDFTYVIYIIGMASSLLSAIAISAVQMHQIWIFN
jgi:hypothetical protein